MNFAVPQFAWLLFILPPLMLLKLMADRSAQRAINSFASSERLRKPLLGGASPVWSGIQVGLQMLGLTLIIIALTRPQFGCEQNEIPQSGRNVFIVIDTSKSMLAEDVSPNRLTRAKLAAVDLLEKLRGDRVGLVAFAGRAFLQSPLTTDHDAVRESIQALDHTTIPRGGSSLAGAIELVLKTIEKSPVRHSGLVLFTDGQETDDGASAAAVDAQKRGVLILPVGMGTPEGTFIPDPDQQGAFIMDEHGARVTAKLESALLQKIASSTGGHYIELATHALTRDAINDLLDQLDAEESASKKETRPIEYYQWPLCRGIICLISSLLMRPSSRKIIKAAALPVDPQTAVHQPARVTVALFAFAFLALGGRAHAVTAKDMQDARKAFEDGRYEESRDAYRKHLEEFLKEHEQESKDGPKLHHNRWSAFRLAMDKAWRSLNSDDSLARRKFELSYGIGASAAGMKNHEEAIKEYSNSLQSPDLNLQERAARGLGTSLYEQGGSMIAQNPDFTINAWTDSITHFDNALRALERLDRKDTAEYAEVRENRDFVKKMLDQLKDQREQQKQQEQKKKPDQQKQKQNGEGKGKGEGEGEPDEKEGQDPQDKDASDEQKQKMHDQLQKQGDQLPEGQLRAADSGQQPQQKPKEGGDDQRNNKTGFTPQEAREQLRNYADEGKTAQFLMRRERPIRGKDY